MNDMKTGLKQTQKQDDDFICSMKYIGYFISEVNEKNDWTIPVDDPEKLGNKIALMHSELSEALEALRLGNVVEFSEHIPSFVCIEEEMADLFIRMVHFCYRMNLRLPQAILAKLKYNEMKKCKYN